MKNLVIPILFLCAFSSATLANINYSSHINPDLEVTGDIDITLSDADQNTFMKSVRLNAPKSQLEFDLKKSARIVQIFNKEGIMEFQLNVNSDKIVLGKSLFSEKHYDLVLIFEDQIETTSVKLTFTN